jgi:hypothetical protein
MNYDIVWPATAEEELAAVWNDADDRNAVTAAVDEVERRLRRDPLGFGESRAEDERLTFYGPLAVYYRVDTARRQVLVLSVGPSGRRP